MRRIITALVIGCAFMGGCSVSMTPVWTILETLRIEEVSSHELPRFPVLVRASSPDSKYTVGLLNDPMSPPPVVSGLSEEALVGINTDLRARISTNQFDHSYFTIKKQGENYVDVELEVPTVHDSMTKTWYQVRDGKIIPQKWVRYGPGFALLVIPWSLLAGFVTAFTTRIVMQRIWPNKAIQRTGNPRHGSCVRTRRATGAGR